MEREVPGVMPGNEILFLVTGTMIAPRVEYDSSMLGIVGTMGTLMARSFIVTFCNQGGSDDGT